MQFQFVPTSFALVLSSVFAYGQEERLPVSLEHAKATFEAIDLDQSHGLEFQELSRTGLKERVFQKFDADWSGSWSEADFLLYYESLLERADRPIDIHFEREVARIKIRRDPMRGVPRSTTGKNKPSEKSGTEETGAKQPVKHAETAVKPETPAVVTPTPSAEETSVPSAKEDTDKESAPTKDAPKSAAPSASTKVENEAAVEEKKPTLILAEQGPPTPEVVDDPQAETTPAPTPEATNTPEPATPEAKTATSDEPQNLLERAQEAQRRRDARRQAEKEAKAKASENAKEATPEAKPVEQKPADNKPDPSNEKP